MGTIKGLSINAQKLDVQLNDEHFSRDEDGVISVIGGVGGNSLVSFTETTRETAAGGKFATSATILVSDPNLGSAKLTLDGEQVLIQKGGTDTIVSTLTLSPESAALRVEDEDTRAFSNIYATQSEVCLMFQGGSGAAPSITLNASGISLVDQVSMGNIDDVEAEINSKIEATDVADIVDDADVVVGVQYYAGSGIRLSDGYINAQCAKPIYIDDYGYIGLRYGTGLAVVNNTLYVSDAGGGDSGDGVYTEGNGITINNNAISVAGGDGIVVTANGVAVSLYTDGVNNLSGLEFYNNKLRADYVQLATNLADNSYGLWGTGLGKIGIDLSSTADVAQDATVATTTASAGLGFDSAGKLCLKLATGLHIDENGYIYIDYPTLAAAISNT